MYLPIDDIDNSHKIYKKCIELSKRVNWDLEKDVMKNRQFDYDQKFLPDGLSLINEFSFLTEREQVFISQIQGRTYAYLFGLVERFIAAKISRMASTRALGDQSEFESLHRFTQEEIKHQAMFQRIEDMLAQNMPAGYVRTADPDAVAQAVLEKSNWAVLGLICHIELFVLVHYKQSIEPDANISELFRDVFLHHWREESQHALLDELEWQKENLELTVEQRDRGVNDLIDLIGAVDGILQNQAQADSTYFMRAQTRNFSTDQIRQLEEAFLKAYRWQYIFSGVGEKKFQKLLGGMLQPEQMQRVHTALAGLGG